MIRLTFLNILKGLLAYITCEKMKKILISFTERQYILLHDEKKQTGCSIGSIIRNSFEDHLRQKGRKSG